MSTSSFKWRSIASRKVFSRSSTFIALTSLRLNHFSKFFQGTTANPLNIRRSQTNLLGDLVVCSPPIVILDYDQPLPFTQFCKQLSYQDVVLRGFDDDAAHR